MAGSAGKPCDDLLGTGERHPGCLGLCIRLTRFGLGSVGDIHRDLETRKILQISDNGTDLDFGQADTTARDAGHRADRVSTAGLAESGNDIGRGFKQRLHQVALCVTRTALVTGFHQSIGSYRCGLVKQRSATTHGIVTQGASTLAVEQLFSQGDEPLRRDCVQVQLLLDRWRRRLDLWYTKIGKPGKEPDHQQAENKNLEKVLHRRSGGLPKPIIGSFSTTDLAQPKNENNQDHEQNRAH